MMMSRRYSVCPCRRLCRDRRSRPSHCKTLPVKVKPAEAGRLELEHKIVKLGRRLDEVVAIDFFGASGREAASGLIAEIESRSRGNKANPSQTRMDREKLRGKIWVTHKGIHIDRMASAWLAAVSFMRRPNSSLYPPKAISRWSHSFSPYNE